MPSRSDCVQRSRLTKQSGSWFAYVGGVIAIVHLALLALKFARGEPYGSVNDAVIVVQYFAGFAAGPVSSPALGSAWSTSKHDRPSLQKYFPSLSRSLRLRALFLLFGGLLLITGYMGRHLQVLSRCLSTLPAMTFVV
jgi:hypothetical protein